MTKGISGTDAIQMFLQAESKCFSHQRLEMTAEK